MIKFGLIMEPSSEEWACIVKGVRNPMNSWDKSDSEWEIDDEPAFYKLGENDIKLMKRLRDTGPDHGKFMRMLNVYMDITAPLYWWKQFDQYKVGVTTNSCSTMHKIHAKEFDISDFSTEHLFHDGCECLMETIRMLNMYRDVYLNGGKLIGDGDIYEEFEPKDKRVWWQLIQLLPSSYNQKRTVMLNYEVLRDIYHARKDHKLDEWREFCEYIVSSNTLDCVELITGKTEE